MEKSILILFLLLSTLILKAQNIDKIIFKGNEGENEEILRDIILSEEGDEFQTKKLSLDLRLLQNFYISKGYLFNSVAVDTVMAGNNFLIVYSINEERLITVGNVDLTGSVPLDRQRIEREFGQRKGEPFTEQLINSFSNYLGLQLANNGYPFARLDGSYEISDTSTANVAIFVDAGPKVYISEIKYWGLQDVDIMIPERETVLELGEVYSDRKINETQNNLYTTGLFEYVGTRMSIPDPADSQQVTINFYLNEVDPRYVELSIGLAYEENVAYNLSFAPGVKIGHNNLWGVGRKASLSWRSEWAFSQQINDINNTEMVTQLQFVEPRVFSSSFTLTTNLGYKEKRGIDRIDYNLWLLQFLLPYRGDERLIDTGFSLQKVTTLEEGKVDTSVIVETDNQELIFSIWGLYTMDVRENYANPIDGSLTSVETKFSYSIPFEDTLAHSQYFTVRSFWNRYQPINRDNSLVYASRISGALILNIGESGYVPYTDRLFLGGANSIRGMAENTAGEVRFQVINNNELIPIGVGGKVSILMNNELRYIIADWGAISIGVEGFIDIGSVWPDIHHIDLSKWHAGTGLGVLLITPLGALRFDYGINLLPRRFNSIFQASDGSVLSYTEPPYVFHFGINFAF